MTNLERGFADKTIQWDSYKDKHLTVLVIKGLLAESDDDMRKIVQYLASEER